MKVFEEFELTNYNSYKIHSKCKRAYFPDSEEDIIDLFSRSQDYVLLGSGHNVILSNSYYEREFIIFNGNFSQIGLNDNGILEAESGVTMYDLSLFALDNGLTGLEIFYDIPSSLGGAVVMNAGASGEEIKDVLVKVRYLDLVDLQVKEIFKEDMDFQYRNSFFQKNTNKIVIKAWLKLESGDCEKIKSKMDQIRSQRWQKQPKDYPNAGSVFKRPKGYYVGALIDELKLKGLTKGGAKVSEKHGGFIINFDGASGKDIIELITEIKDRVMGKFGIELEVEQRII
ncbi:UDP-N-acetylmuramate dehydrogenase [Echinicola jeungdonensis]|uniref:UDP-N-acetylenolpyruvoylglucosamine reductase n=1 Tax=Echinicola jeungdonensis TaxID=709343 RepID=A0ABV5J4N9_9BACT|nr:UDP-N-acetylmuramate dehydrogenase [Echinicola jeungdonensis]MDN3668120.1 UDP-N-acetylmuramate dehydrogenase [Echinicola jeungdonensis]